MLGAFFFLFKFHRAVWAYPKDSALKNYLILGFAYFTSVAVGSLSAAANFQTYPITYFLYLFIGVSLVAFYAQKKEAVLVDLEQAEGDSISDDVVLEVTR